MVNMAYCSEILPNCKICGSKEVVRYGTSKGVQRWWCKDCQHKFINNNAISNMRIPKDQIASAISEYYNGSSINAIRKSLEQKYKSFLSESTIYSWIIHFSKVAINEANNTQVEVGLRWIIDETTIKIGGKEYWLIDIIDASTRFLLARQLSFNRKPNDVRVSLIMAKERAGKTPEQIIADRWSGYTDSIKLAYGLSSQQIEVGPVSLAPDMGLIELWQIMLRDRLKIMRGLKKEETAYLILDGLLVHYNFFRAQASLSQQTPSQLAKARFAYNSWTDVIYKAGNREITYQPASEIISDLVLDTLVPGLPGTAGAR
jgi:putative transposase